VDAKDVKVFVSAAASAPVQRDGFTDLAFPNPGTRDSAKDIARVIDGVRGLRTVKRPTDAAVLLQVVSREEQTGHYLVHVQVTVQDHRFELTGASIHTWYASGDDVVGQLNAWVKANRTHFQ